VSYFPSTHFEWYMCVQLPDLEEDQKIVRCKQLVEELIEPNKTVFRYVIDFLVKVRSLYIQ